MAEMTKKDIEKAKRKELYDGLGRKARIMLLISRIVVYTILAFLMVLCLFSFYMLIINATRSNSQLQSGFTLIPKENFLNNFKNAWTDASINIPRGMLNSFIIAAASAILTTYFSALTAYGIHCYDFRGKKVAFTFIMAVMMIPSQVSAVGFIAMVNTLGLTDNYIPLIVPAIASPIVFFYMKQYMEANLSNQIVEAARVDGANEFYTFNRIVIPIMMPAIAVQMIFSFVGSWNNFFIPAMVLDDKSLRTVPIMIANLRSADYSKFDMGKVYMFILMAILPVVVVYLALSKFIIGGVSDGAVKG